LSPIKRYSLFGLIYMVFMVKFSSKFNKAIWCTSLFFIGCFKLDIKHLLGLKPSTSIGLLAGYAPEFD
jgi:hypothetical protein